MQLSLYYFDEEESHQRKYIERVLGVSWDRDTLHGMLEGSGKGNSDTIFIPLSMILKPDLIKDLAQFATGGKSPSGPIPKDSENLFDRSKEAFISMMQGMMPRG